MAEAIGDGNFPAAGNYAGGYCKTRGEGGGTFVARYHDGTGGTYEQERFEAASRHNRCRY